MSLSEAHWEIGFTIGIIRHHATLVGRRRRPNMAYCLRRACRAGASRSRPQAAKWERRTHQP